LEQLPISAKVRVQTLVFPMNEADRPAQVIRFGVFEANLQTGELRKNGCKVPLQGQPFQVCAILLLRSGELVTREELRKRVWPDDTFVDFDQALNTAIAKIRIALDDDADNPRFVQTLPRRGYRFITPIKEPSPRAPLAAKGRLKIFSAKTWGASVGVTLLALLGTMGFFRFLRNRSEAPLRPIEVVSLAALPGFEVQPSFSPDGNQVAFALHAKETSGIYTIIAGGEKSLRLTSNSTDCCPKWSPDGRQVAFSRYSHEGIAVYAIPALGGTERRLWLGTSTLPPAWRTSGRSIDWSPDGKVVAFSDIQADRAHAWITLLSIGDSTTRRLTSPQSQNLDYGPAFSPDGSAVAFVRGIAPGVVEDLYVVPTAGGEPKRLTFDNAWLSGPPTWTPDGRDIVFSSRRGGLASLWRIPASGGTPRPIPGAGANAVFPSISPKGNQLVYQQLTFKNTIWRLNLRDEKAHQGPPAVVTSDKSIQTSRAQFSPEGKRIVFESDRLGYSEIWACDSDGSNCGQLTSLRGIAGAPRWSPDGQYIAFEYRPKEYSEVYLLEVASGVPRLLTTLPGANNGGPNWSRDGKWVYFYSDRGGGPFQLWKIQLSGGPPVQVTRKGGIFAAESNDGRFLYYSKFESAGIWKMPLNGGEEIRILDRPAGEDWWNWALVQNGIYFVDLTRRTVTGEANPRPAIVKFFDFAAGEETSIVTLTADKPYYVFGLAVSPDRSSILYHQREYESTIMLVKNFR
jgi:Tol biopolymer transport system component/DNA-binding winged helix-turn-helix (wHTH) protein